MKYLTDIASRGRVIASRLRRGHARKNRGFTWMDVPSNDSNAHPRPGALNGCLERSSMPSPSPLAPPAQNGASVPTASSPEQTIRRYLDQHGGTTNATVDHLLKTFGVDEDDADGRGRITTALARAGVGIDRPLPFLAEDEGVRLFLSDSDGTNGTPAGANRAGSTPVVRPQSTAPAAIPPSAPPPAGWYPDPSSQGGQRYWDGAEWTDHRHPAAPSYGSAPAVEEGGTSGLVIGGYVLAFIIPFVGFILGIVVATRPTKAVSKHGIWIIVLSVVAFFFWLAVISSGSSTSSY